MEVRKIVLGLLLFSATTFAGVIGPGEYWYGDTELRDEVGYDIELIVNGGGADSILAYDNSTVVINSTSTPLTSDSGVGLIMLHDSSGLMFKDGVNSHIYSYGNATAVLSGGLINHIRSYQDAIFTGEWDDLGNPIYDGHIDMIVKTHDYNTSTKLLTGTWADDTAFSIQLHNEDGFDPAIMNIDFIIVPEPITLLLFGLGGLVLRKKTFTTQN